MRNVSAGAAAVFGTGHWIEMIRIDTASIMTEMIELETAG